MTVMDLYSPLPLGELPAPPGTSLPPGFPPFADIASRLNLPAFGLFTPWAARSSGVAWEDVAQPPDTNVMAFSLTDLALQMLHSLMGAGQDLPFVVVMTPTPLTPQQVTDSFNGTPYSFYETQAVYAQTDAKDPPTPVYMHWLQRRSPGDHNDGNGSMDKSTSAIGGKLLYAFPVDYNSTAKRKPPAITYSLLTGSNANTVPTLTNGDITPVPPVVVPTPAKKSGWGLVLLVGAGAATAAFFAAREVRHGR